MSTKTLEEVRETLKTSEPVVAHIVAPSAGRDGAAICLEARINSTEVKCLCGHVLVPSRDPLGAGVVDCAKCLSLFAKRFGPGAQPSMA
jgi:hypothetical protein